MRLIFVISKTRKQQHKKEKFEFYLTYKHRCKTLQVSISKANPKMSGNRIYHD